MSIHLSAFPMVCDSSWIWYVAADRSGSAPFSCNKDDTIGQTISYVRVTGSTYNFDLGNIVSHDRNVARTSKEEEGKGQKKISSRAGYEEEAK